MDAGYNDMTLVVRYKMLYNCASQIDPNAYI